MHKVTKLGTTTLLSIGLTSAAFVGVASAGEQLSKKEFRQEANAVCEVANEDIGNAFDDAFTGLTEGQEPSAEQIQAAVDAALPIFRAMLDSVEALDGPSAYEKKVDKALDQYRVVADDVEEDPAIAFSAEGENIWAKPDRAARKLGLKVCLQGS